MTGDGLGHGVLGLGDVGLVGHDEGDGPEARELCDEGLGPVGVPPGDDDAGALAQSRSGDARAETGGPADDEDDPVGEQRLHAW